MKLCHCFEVLNGVGVDGVREILSIVFFVFALFFCFVSLRPRLYRPHFKLPDTGGESHVPWMEVGSVAPPNLKS